MTYLAALEAQLDDVRQQHPTDVPPHLWCLWKIHHSLEAIFQTTEPGDTTQDRTLVVREHAIQGQEAFYQLLRLCAEEPNHEPG